MSNDASNTGFQSVLAAFIDQFLQEKHACGYAYHEPIRMLHRLDDFVMQQGLNWVCVTLCNRAILKALPIHLKTCMA